MSNYIEVQEVMAILGVSRQTVTRWVNNGRLTKYKMGSPMPGIPAATAERLRPVRFSRTEVEALAHELSTVHPA
jgi:excisionase family DNA binding protein